jgi:hypothetical protein
MKRSFFITLSLSVLLSGCSAQYHLKRAIAKDPTILLQPKAITLIDTVVTQEVRHDTLLLPVHDTLTIQKERLRIQIKRVNDTIRITGECLTDTIIITKEIELPPKIVYKEKDNFWQTLITRLFLVLAIFAVGRYLLDRYLSK